MTVIPCLIGIFLFTQRITQLTIAQTIFFSVSMIALINYVAITLGIIYPVDNLIISFGFIWLIFEFLQYVVFKRPLRFSISLLIIYLGIIILITFVIHDACFYYWDEFSFWGKISKLIYQTNLLPDINTPINFKDYPPGAALFHYFIYRILGKFSEPIAFLAQDILLIAPLFAIAAANNDRNLSAIIGLIILLIASVAFYEPALLQNLYVDILVGCYFAGIISIIYLTKNSAQKYLTIFPVILFLTLIKQVGLFFAEFTIIMLIVDFLLDRNVVKKRMFFSYLTLLITLLIILHQSWVIHYHQLNIEKTFGTHTMHIQTIIKDLIYTENKTISLIKQVFYKAWFYPGKEISARVHTSVAIQLFIFIIMSYFLIRWEKDNLNRKRYLMLFLFLFVGLLAYSAGLLTFYMYSFSSVEAVCIASFGRYMHIYLIAYTLIMIGLLSKYITFSLLNNKMLMTLFTAVFIIVLIIGKPHAQEKMSAKRVEVIQTAQRLAQIKSNMKLFVIYQNDQNDDSAFINILQYELFPIKVNQCTSFGQVYHFDDNTTCERTLKELTEELKHYDYLLIAHADKQFWQRYGRLFDDQHTSQLYKIDQQGGLHSVG
jgi:hypothetical protein